MGSVVEYEEKGRCGSRCPFETFWSIGLKQNSWTARHQNTMTRCTLVFGHDGDHLGPDDSRWYENSSSIS